MLPSIRRKRADDPIPPRDPSDPRPYDCLVISDLHLGSALCQAKLIEEFLEWAVDHTRELVINGDIFDDLNFKRLSKRHFACLKLIRRHSDRDDFKVVWMRGNHDGPAEIVNHIVGVEIWDEYVYRNGEVDLLIFHGDQFDTIITNYALLTNLACGTYYFIQKYAPHNTSRWLRRTTKRWQRNSTLIQQRAIEYARSQGYRYVTCGHTHLPLTAVSEDGITYINSGTWMDLPPCPFVSVRGSEVKLETWPRMLEGPFHSSDQTAVTIQTSSTRPESAAPCETACSNADPMSIAASYNATTPPG